MKLRNQWVLFAVLLLALISLSPGEESALTQQERQGGTGFVPQPKQKAEKDTGSIRVAVSMEPEEFDRLNKLNEQFMIKHQLEVELVNIEEKEAYQTYKTSLELGEAPDVLLLDNAWVREFASRGYLLPVESYYSGQAGVDSLSTSLNQNTWNGYLWGVPKDHDPYVIIYSPGRLQELGFKQLPQTQAEWAELASRFKKRNQTADWVALNMSDPYADLSLLWRMGLSMNSKKDEDFHLTPGMKSAFSHVAEFRNRFFPAADNQAARDQIWDKMERGEILLYVTPASTFDADDNPSLKLEFPSSADGVRMLWLKGRSYSLTAQSQHIKTAGAWITVMTSPEQQISSYKEGNKLPAMKELYQDTRLKELQAWLNAIQNRGKSGALPVDAKLPELLSQFSAEASAYLNGTGKMESFMASFTKLNHAARP
ncbi:ABC transporter substrate-binding protein [Paenibacillus tuaregi]|uniref:ABC transporter substrate-binding protein n=1 Tax=Paenibacillus tuaregi TaxID=1816681 RepID=UPI0008386C0E|nr:extracellular solute-binding protein [Paenibacillus tuaregi]